MGRLLESIASENPLLNSEAESLIRKWYPPGGFGGAGFHPGLSGEVRGCSERSRRHVDVLAGAVEAAGEAVGLTADQRRHGGRAAVVGAVVVGAVRIHRRGAGGLVKAPVVADPRGREDGRAVGAVDRQRARRRRRRAVVVGHPQPDRQRRGGGEGFGRAGGRARAGLIAAVAVEVPLVFGDRAVGIDRAGGIEVHRLARVGRATA